MIHKIFFDGGTQLDIVCIFDKDRNKHFIENMKEILTNNQLEYTALLKAVRYAVSYYGSPRDVTFCGDSELIIKQMKGEYKVKRPHLRVLKEEIMKVFLRCGITSIESNFNWVPRSKNLAGIVLDDLLIKAYHGRKID